MREVDLRIAVGLALTLFLSACQQQWVYDAERNRRDLATGQYEEAHYDVPSQVVYRIDDHRFLTLEDYNGCLGHAWYNDTRTGVRTSIGLMWPTGFRGKLIIDNLTGMSLAARLVTRGVCGDRGCPNYVAYSTDGGRTFHRTQYDIHYSSHDPVADSKKYAVLMTKDSMYVALYTRSDGSNHDSEDAMNSMTILQKGELSLVDRFPLAPGYVYGKNAKLPEGVGIQFNSTLPTGLHTPSGASRFTCDDSIHDSNAPKP